MYYPQTSHDSNRISNVITSVITPAGELLDIYYHFNTGKVVTCKQSALYGKSECPAILLGTDKYGNLWVAHNRAFRNKPAMDTLPKYALGQTVVYGKCAVNYTSLQTAKRAVREVLKAKPYDAFLYNEDIFVDTIVKASKVHAMEKLSEAVRLKSALSALLKMIR